MKSREMLTVIIGVLGAASALCQIQPPAGLRSGPGVQAAQDEREPEVLKACKTPPPDRSGRGGPGRGRGAAAPGPREYKVSEIQGVVAAGQQWKEIWEVDGNNADGIIATGDGGILIAQNDKSDVLKLDKNGKTSIPYSGTNTGGSVAVNSKGVLFIANRGLNPSIDQLAPQHKTLANKSSPNR